MCATTGITSVEDAFRLPKGKLLRAVKLHRYTAPIGWVEYGFSKRQLRWAAKQVICKQVTRKFSSQAQLIVFALRKHPWQAFWYGLDGIFRSAKPEKRCGDCSNCPLKQLR